ncbi:MAG: ABC transporter ATP-binding protein [Candidatus Velamenicoccus archaeovorus]
MPSERPIASCVGVVKTYRTSRSEVRALKGIDARFPSGALTTVVGPSGSGKSSLLRLLAGLDRPDAGTIEVAGVAVHRASARRLRRLRRTTVGYVFQRASDNFFSHLTVGEHLAMAAHHRQAGMEPAEVLDLLEIGHRAEHRPEELSGGEQQRAAFAQVLVAGARLVVADEPTAELDSGSAADVLRLIRTLVGRGVSFVLATHDRDVMRAADAVVALEHGDVVRRPHRSPTGAVRSDRDEDEGWFAAGPVLEVRSLRKTYRRGDEQVHAVAGADLEVRRGELVGLVGRSGSGKTTLLNVVAGWERPDDGRIALDGRELGRIPSWSEVAVLPQRLGLIEELTIRENVEYPARLTGTRSERRAFVDGLIEAFGLEALQHRYPKETSVGEQQRAALARALVLSPLVVLADEPTGHQDRGWTERIFEAIRREAGGGTACLMATHDEDLIGFLDRVLTMADGRLGELPA